MTAPVKLSSSDPKVTGCSSWQHQVNAAQLLAQDADLVAYLDTVPPGVDWFSWNGSLWQYVNNLDGSQGNTYGDVPAGNTGIYLCTGGAITPPGWSTKKKVLVFGGAAALVAALVAGGIYLHKRKDES